MNYHGYVILIYININFTSYYNRWRVFLTTIKLSPDKVTYVIMAACCLHNYLVEKNKTAYTSACDIENADHTVSEGIWRSDPTLIGIQTSPTRNPPKNAKDQRQHLTTYFNNRGSVPWQDSMIV